MFIAMPRGKLEKDLKILTMSPKEYAFLIEGEVLVTLFLL